MVLSSRRITLMYSANAKPRLKLFAPTTHHSISSLKAKRLPTILPAPLPLFVHMPKLARHGGWKACGSWRALPATTICIHVSAQVRRAYRSIQLLLANTMRHPDIARPRVTWSFTKVHLRPVVFVYRHLKVITIWQSESFARQIRVARDVAGNTHHVVEMLAAIVTAAVKNIPGTCARIH